MSTMRYQYYQGKTRISEQEARQPEPWVCPTCGKDTSGFHQCWDCRNDPELHITAVAEPVKWVEEEAWAEIRKRQDHSILALIAARLGRIIELLEHKT